MPTKGSVTGWLDQARQGDADAAQQLWQRYFGRLVGLARVKLRGAPRGMADEEDIALSAFDSMYRGIEQNRFPQLGDRNNLWGLLVVITARKAANWKRDQNRQKRAGNNRADEPAVDGERSRASASATLEEMISREPSPEFAAQLAEQCQRLLDGLGEEMLRTIARCKMEGYTNAEIARQLKCAPRTVERKLALIRSRWEKENEP